MASSSPYTLQQLSDYVSSTITSHPEYTDLTVWTHVDYCAMKVYRIDVISEGNVGVVVTWLNDLEEPGTPFTLRTFSERLLDIISERPDLATDYVWRHMFPSGCEKIVTVSVERESAFGWDVVLRG
jgi:hypothetical protein